MTTESRTALITGASSGLGAAIALEMATRGWKLAIGARRADRLAETAENVRAQGAAEVYAGDLDVADDASVERFFEASETAVGVADVIEGAEMARTSTVRGWKTLPARIEYHVPRAGRL